MASASPRIDQMRCICSGRRVRYLVFETTVVKECRSVQRSTAWMNILECHRSLQRRDFLNRLLIQLEEANLSRCQSLHAKEVGIEEAILHHCCRRRKALDQKCWLEHFCALDLPTHLANSIRPAS